MRWIILILILSSLILFGCTDVGHFEKEPILEQYILLRTESVNRSIENSGIIQDSINPSEH